MSLELSLGSKIMSPKRERCELGEVRASKVFEVRGSNVGGVKFCLQSSKFGV